MNNVIDFFGRDDEEVRVKKLIEQFKREHLVTITENTEEQAKFIQKDLDTQLIRSVRNSSYSKVKECLEKGASPNLDHQDLAGVSDSRMAERSPLMEGICGGDTKVVGLLLDHGARFNKFENERPRGLHEALRNSNLEMIKEFYSHGYSLNVEEPGSLVGCGKTVLHFAAERGDLAIVHWLLEREPSLKSEKDELEDTPLHLACKSYYSTPEIVKALLEKGCDPHVKNKAGIAPLQLSCLENRADIVPILMEYGADPNGYFQYENGEVSTPLHWAVVEGHPKIVSKMLEKGADLNLRDGEKSTPISLAAHRKNVEMLELLLDRGADWSHHILCHYNGIEVTRGLNLSKDKSRIVELLIEYPGNRSQPVLTHEEKWRERCLKEHRDPENYQEFDRDYDHGYYG